MGPRRLRSPERSSRRGTHHQEGQVALAVDAGVEHLGDVLRIDRSGGASLALEAADQRFITGQVARADDFDGDAPPRRSVLRFVNRAHRACPEEAIDSIFAVEGRA